MRPEGKVGRVVNSEKEGTREVNAERLREREREREREEDEMCRFSRGLGSTRARDYAYP